jgi:GDSL-like Lipase/Acylhydrolase
MMRRLHWLNWGVLIACGMSLVLAGCELDETNPVERTEGPIPGSKMGVLGNSLSAGFQNGGLEETGQNASFTNLLSQAMTGRSLQMPLVGAPGLGSESGMTPLFVDADGDITRDALTVGALQLAKNLTYHLPYDNLGVPGFTTRQMLDKMSALDEVKPDNPFTDLILRNSALPGSGSAMRQLERITPEIITIWTGNNEILGGALSGSPQSADPAAPGFIVPAAAFEPDFIRLCDRVEALEPEMVAVANVPPIASIPYTRFFGTGSIPGINRWAMEEDFDGDGDDVQLVLLTAPLSDCIGCYLPSCVFDPSSPCDSIPAANTLTFSEVALINDTIDEYNQIIAREAAARGWALVDINTFFQILPNTPADAPINVAFPWQVNPISGVGTQNTNSAFTLDGVHPSEKGHVEVANQFLTAINGVYGTEYAMLDVDAATNVAGFEQVLGKSVTTASSTLPRITPEARGTLTSMAEMMRARY